MSFGGEGHASASAVAVAGDGRIVVVGSFDGTLVVGGDTLRSAGGRDAFVAVLDDHGAARRAESFGGPGHDAATAVAVDPGGAILVAGRSESGASVRGRVVSEGAFVARLDDAGAEPAVAQLAAHYATVRDLAALDDGGVIAVGYFAGELALGGAALASPAGDHDGFAMRLEPGLGRAVWVRTVGSPGADFANSVAIDAAGNAVVGGSIAPDDEDAEQSPAPDGFVVVLEPGAGVPVQLDRIGGDGADSVVAVAVGAEPARQWAIGTFDAPMLFDGTPIEPTGTPDVFVRVTEPSTLFALGREDTAGPMDAVAFGAELIVCGAGASRRGGMDAFVARLGGGGVGWVKQLGGPGQDEATGVAIAGDRVVVVGSFTGTAQLGEVELVARGARDVFVLKLKP